MKEFAWVIAGAIGSVGAFWLVIRYVLSKLDSKVEKDVFDQYCLRVTENLATGNRRFDKIDVAIISQTTAIQGLSREVGELCVSVKQSLGEKMHRRISNGEDK